MALVEDDEGWPVELSALTYLQSIYRNPSESEGRRLKAAALALPFEAPKLSAMAIASMSGKEFAVQLEKAIARSTGAKLIEAKPLPQTE